VTWPRSRSPSRHDPGKSRLASPGPPPCDPRCEVAAARTSREAGATRSRVEAGLNQTRQRRERYAATRCSLLVAGSSRTFVYHPGCWPARRGWLLVRSCAAWWGSPTCAVAGIIDETVDTQPYPQCHAAALTRSRSSTFKYGSTAATPDLALCRDRPGRQLGHRLDASRRLDPRSLRRGDRMTNRPPQPTPPLPRI
jgi:hypothetical protein